MKLLRWTPLGAAALLAGACATVDPQDLFIKAYAAPDAKQKIRLYSRFLDARPAPNERVVALNNRANAYRDAGDPVHALRDYDEALALYDQSAEIYTNRGDLYLQLAETERALADFDRAVVLNPHAPQPYNHRGFVKRKRGQFDAALEDYNHALEVAPDHAPSYLGRGVVRWEMNRLEAAVLDFSRAIALDKQSVAAYDNRGAVYRQIGDYDRAMADFAAALELAPEDPGVHRNRAITYALQGEDAQALADYDFALRYSKSYGDRVYTLLMAQLPETRLGPDRKFESRLKQVVVRSNDWPLPALRFYRGELAAAAVLAAAGTDPGRLCEAYYYLGAHALMHGRADDAKDDFRRALGTNLSGYIEYALAHAELDRLAPVARLFPAE